MTLKNVVDGGDYMVVYPYCNWDHNPVLILPTPDATDIEALKNKELIDMFDGLYSDFGIIQDFMGKHPDTPFITIHEDMVTAIGLATYKVQEAINLNRLEEELATFIQFRDACYNIQLICGKNGNTAVIEDAYHNGWEKYIDTKE